MSTAGPPGQRRAISGRSCQPGWFPAPPGMFPRMRTPAFSDRLNVASASCKGVIPSGVFLPQQECLRPSRERAHSSRRRPCIQDLNSLALMEWEPALGSPLVQMAADPTNRGQRGSEGQLWGSGLMWVAYTRGREWGLFKMASMGL